MRIASINGPRHPDVAPFLVGLISLPAQALLCRELLARGGGNEIVLTLYLALWLAGSAAGALFWGARWGIGAPFGGNGCTATGQRPPNGPISGRMLIVLGPAVAAAALVVARFLPSLGSRPGEIQHPAAIGLAGLLVLFPAAFMSAGLFPLAARGGGSDASGHAMERDSGRPYIAEALGAMAGGCATTAAVMLRIAPVAILTLVVAIATALAFPRLKGLIVAAVLAALAIVGFSTRLDDALFEAAWSGRHPGLHLVAHAMTPTRTLALASREGERWLLADDAPREVLDDPHRDEATAALLLAVTPDRPARVLLVDFGASGVARALDQAMVPRDLNGLPRVACLLPDREDTLLVRPIPGVASIVGDPRHSLRKLQPGWDVIAIASSEGTSIAANRLWTTEAFREMASRLAPRGAIVAIAPGGDAAPGPETRAWRASVASALARATGETPTAIDADRFVLVASSRPGEATIDPDSLSARYVRGGGSLATYPAARFAVEYPRGRQIRITPRSAARANSDARPAAFAYAIGRWLRLSGMPAPPRPLLIALAAALIAVPIGVITIHTNGLPTRVAADVRRSETPESAAKPADVRRPGGRDARLGAAVLLATGATSMGLDLLVLMSYQARVGMLQAGLGALLGAFLGGTAFGALYSSRRERDMGGLCLAQAAVAAAAAILLPRFPPVTVVFAVIAFVLGMTCGAPFPLAARAIGAGRAWAADAAGGIIGAVLVLLVVSQGIVTAGLVLALPPLLTGLVMLASGRGAPGVGLASESPGAGLAPAAMGAPPTSSGPGSPPRTSGSGRP